MTNPLYDSVNNLILFGSQVVHFIYNQDSEAMIKNYTLVC
jgi:hypothetical protein